MKQTAVNWLVEQIKSDQNQKALSANEWMEVIEQAKALEKSQIMKAQSYAISHADMTNNKGEFDCEQYYNKTYGDSSAMDI
jgi:hypothetical protein